MAVAVWAFATVTSNGQHDIPPPGRGFLSLGFPGAPPEWWGHFSMSAIGPDCLVVSGGVEELWIGLVFASMGSVQPMKQAKTAIHKEINVAVPALKVRIGEYMTSRLYASIHRTVQPFSKLLGM